jgi:hypothetical protein
MLPFHKTRVNFRAAAWRSAWAHVLSMSRLPPLRSSLTRSHNAPTTELADREKSSISEIGCGRGANPSSPASNNHRCFAGSEDFFDPRTNANNRNGKRTADAQKPAHLRTARQSRCLLQGIRENPRSDRTLSVAGCSIDAQKPAQWATQKIVCDSHACESRRERR